MSATLPDLDAWVVRLQTTATELVRAGGSADLMGALETGTPRTPAAYVVPGQEQPSPNNLDSGLIQMVRLRVSVFLAVRNARDAQGEAAMGELRPVRQSVMDALLGWQPDDCDEQVVFAGGRPVQNQDRVLWWQDDYDTVYLLRK